MTLQSRLKQIEEFLEESQKCLTAGLKVEGNSYMYICKSATVMNFRAIIFLAIFVMDQCYIRKSGFAVMLAK